MRGWRVQDFASAWEQRDITRDRDRLTGIDPMEDLYPSFELPEDDDNDARKELA
jgi:hypothetical protein